MSSVISSRVPSPFHGDPSSDGSVVAVVNNPMQQPMTPLQQQLMARYRQQQQPQAQSNPMSAVQGIGNIAKDVGGGAKLASSILSPKLPTGFVGPVAPSTGANIAGNIAGIAGRYVIPGFGAALGGYQFLKDRGTNWGNIASGTGTGASIGTMVMPGIGTAIGAGIGAAAGGVKDLINHFRVSPEEEEGRQGHQNVYDFFSSVASPQQKQEAQQAVQSGAWHETNPPLSLIVMRDNLIKQGVPVDQAVNQSNKWGTDLWQAEKGGNSAMQSAFSPIYSQLFAPKQPPIDTGGAMGQQPRTQVMPRTPQQTQSGVPIQRPTTGY
jgi:hypothetical protein